MKSLTRFLPGLLAVVLLAATACQKQGTLPVLSTGASPVLSGSASSVVLDSAHDADNAVTFSWNAAAYGYPADVTYTLQFDVPADSFQSAVSVVLPVNDTVKTYTVKDFNQLVFQSLRLPANTASPLVVRVKADVNQNGVITGPSTVASVYSGTFDMQATPYQIIIVYPLLWMPGDYQNWDPATAPTLASVTSNGVYEGYVELPAASANFKFTEAPDWNHTNYGDAGSTGNAGKVSATGGNLLVTGAGYYQVKVDLNADTWAAVKTTWAVIGDATPGGWDADTPLTYDAGTGQWTAKVALTAGGFVKFRANGAWDINLGDNTPANGYLAYGGGNIPVATSGTYEVTLDLSHPGNYTYQLVKQ